MRTLALLATLWCAGALGDPVLTVTPSQVAHSGDEVTFSWSGVSSANAADWIGIWTGGSTYVAYKNSAYDQPGSSVEKGSGSLKVKLYNMRLDNYTFWYYPSTAKTHMSSPLAISPPVTFVHGNLEPTQLHIALTANPSEMRVMWVSGRPESPPTVRFGLNGEMDQMAQGTSKTYSQEDLCEASPINDVAWVPPGWIHDVLLTGLKPGEVYTYVAGADDLWTAPETFQTATEDPSKPFSFLIYADMGTAKEFCASCAIHETQSYGPGAQALVSQIEKRELKTGQNPPEFIVHEGDISYARNTALKWDVFFDTIYPIASKIPYLVSIGNHEYDHLKGGKGKDPSGAPTDNGYHPGWGDMGDDSDGECAVPMFNRFHVPDTGNSLFWYSFEKQSVHYIVISIEHSLEVGSAQRAWLENDLKSVDRSVTPWLFMGAHRPVYCSEADKSDFNVAVALQGIIGDLLQQYNVDVFTAGHYHSYERTCPVYNNTCRESQATGQPQATVHITVGTAGIAFDTPNYYKEDWSLVRFPTVYAYGRVDIFNSTDMRWSLIDSFNGTVIDSLDLHTDHDFTN